MPKRHHNKERTNKMEFFNTILSFASMAVSGFGGGVAISGLMAIGEGKSQNQPGKVDEGVSKIVGGGVIIAVGILLVPQLATFLSV